jgi:2-hydroxychromene-2-carboxylate isomerase
MGHGHLESALLSRVGLAAQQMGIFDKVNDALFGAVWTGSQDLVTQEGRLQFSAIHDIPAALWEIAESPTVSSALAANTERAIADGVFGVPTLFVGQEMFFGNDRLPFVKEALSRITTEAAG